MASVHFCRCMSRSRTSTQLKRISLWTLSLTRALTVCGPNIQDFTVGQHTCTTRNTYCNIYVSFSTHPLLGTPVKPRKFDDVKKTDDTAAVSKPIFRITVHDSDGKVLGTMAKEEAQRVARHRNLKLVLVENPDTSRNHKKVYKLLTGKELHDERMKEKLLKQEREPEERDSKTLILSTKISSHDIETRVKAVKKWLKKNHSVCVTIQSSQNETNSQEEVFQAFEIGLDGLGKLYQKRLKDGTLKFTIQPVKIKNEDS